MPALARVKCFFESDSGTCQYVVWCDETRECALIDPVRNYSNANASTSERCIDELCAFVDAERLHVVWLLDTHVHADHFSGVAELKRRHPSACTAMGRRFEATRAFGAAFFGADVDGDLGRAECTPDRLFDDNDEFRIGELRVRCLHVPGHTPESAAYYVVDDAVFVGDTMFAPDLGTARADFLHGGSVHELWRSCRRLLALGDDVRCFLCHDYPPAGGRAAMFETTLGVQRRENKHVGDATSEAQFVERRAARDLELPHPRLLLPSFQVNMRLGALPKAESDGKSYLKIPLNSYPHCSSLAASASVSGSNDDANDKVNKLATDTRAEQK